MVSTHLSKPCLEFTSSYPSQSCEKVGSEEPEDSAGPGNDGAAVARHAVSLTKKLLLSFELCHLHVQFRVAVLAPERI